MGGGVKELIQSATWTARFGQRSAVITKGPWCQLANLRKLCRVLFGSVLGILDESHEVVGAIDCLRSKIFHDQQPTMEARP